MCFIGSIFSLKNIEYKLNYESDSSIALVVYKNDSILNKHIGKHTITRVPPTEKKGRRHTSVIAIAYTAIEEINLEIKEKDLDVSFMRSGGKGGQNVNKVESAVRIVHKPTGIAVRCDQERDQHKNRALALKILKNKIIKKRELEHYNSLHKNKSTQLDSMGRSNKIITWNLYEGVITNHITGNQTRKIKEVLKGYLDLI